MGANLRPNTQLCVIVARSLRSRLKGQEHSSRDRRKRATITHNCVFGLKLHVARCLTPITPRAGPGSPGGRLGA